MNHFRCIVVLAVSVGVAASAGAQDLTLSIGEVDARGLSMVTVPVELTSGAGLAATMLVSVEFQSIVFDVIDVRPGEAVLAADKEIAFEVINSSLVQLAIFGINLDTIPLGTVAYIDFSITDPNEKSAAISGGKGAAPGEFLYALSGTNASAATPSASSLAVVVTNGSILSTIVFSLPVSGILGLTVFTLFMLALGLATLKRRRRLLGLLLVLLVPWTAFAAPIAGDLDQSGVVDSLDMEVFLAGLFSTPAPQSTDLDFSGSADATDLQLLVLAILGLAEDEDSDGILDVGEVNLGTNPAVEDTDADGVGDGQEILDGTDPLSPPSLSGDVIINEFVASNLTGLQDEDGEFPDWIELYNGGTAAVNMLGWSLSDDPLLPQKWVLPDVSIAPDGFLVVFASSKNRVVGPNLHTNFRMGRTGEYLALSDPSGTATSIFEPQYPEQVTDISYGRYGVGPEFRYFSVPTPWAHNLIRDDVFTGFVTGLTVSPPRGFYDVSFDITMSVGVPNAVIKYTLDGTEPTATNGIVYTAPIPTSASTAVRARALADGFMPSKVETLSYLLNVPADQRTLPAFAIVADPTESLFEPNGVMSIIGGHYEVGAFNIVFWVRDTPADINNPLEHGRAFERPASFELIKPLDNSGFQVDAGMRVSGSDFHRLRYRRDPGADWTVPGPFANMASYNKFSLRMYFRSDYGPARLVFPLFEDPSVIEYDKLVLRGGHNDGFNPFIRDELARRLHFDMGQVAARGMLANLFINGEFKAYYNVTERLDEEFFQTWYNSIVGWDIMGQGGGGGSTWEIKEGDDIVWAALIDAVRTNDLSIQSNYDAVAGMMDIANFIDYIMAELYSGNDDWPNNNWVAARERSLAGLFRFFVWDTEGSFGGSIVGAENANLLSTGINSFPFWGGNVDSPGGGGLKAENTPIAWLYRGLVQNAGFRAQFSARAHELFDTGGALHFSNVAARYIELRDQMLPVRPTFKTFIGDSWVANREAVLTAELAAEGLY